MDGSHFPSDKPMPDYSLYGEDFDDPALKNNISCLRREHTETDRMVNTRRFARRVLNELRQPYRDCHCGCQGINHIDPTARRILLDLLEIQTRSPSEPAAP
jgi:hypothetical protein